MGKVLRCDCGYEARADDEDGLIAEVRRHAREAHGMPLSHAEALRLTRRGSSITAASPETTAPRAEKR